MIGSTALIFNALITGGTADIKFSSVGVHHEGGHCQFSLSYDNGAKFFDIHTTLGDCKMAGKSVSIPIPSDAPAAKKAVLAWSWVNKVGVRGFYMNCADVTITNTSASKTTEFYSRPRMVIANFPGGVTIGEFPNDTNDGREYYPSDSRSGSGDSEKPKDPVIPLPTSTSEEGSDSTPKKKNNKSNSKDDDDEDEE
ncbi:hypothetical protein H4R33_000574 [Dimargaris cristalligena]|uniref:Chitin-binding type-4 domain-containing protein n=1 Tax=Dimargaris cristalligena TaxID=215637 RepID=A0A4P9ZWL6_9FUNG|nr:hypothetical protein H4R33_000574 [Dimargaris cristalligena]RKP38017.1 hypothetical protein BJ085DRAFT_40291 [Dimargaris cristalligena]|eukprot:RKP38017.1 hypothetical protein BJ085DRAFT_40291 [Dimargaris cristalligena]